MQAPYVAAPAPRVGAARALGVPRPRGFCGRRIRRRNRFAPLARYWHINR